MTEHEEEDEPQERPFLQPPDTCPFCGEPMKVLREVGGMPVVQGCDCKESKAFMEEMEALDTMRRSFAENMR